MKKTYIISDNIINSLGFTTGDVFHSLKEGISGIRICNDRKVTPVAVPLSRMDDEQLFSRFGEIAKGAEEDYTRMEKMFILSIHDAMQKAGRDFTGNDTLLIISTTKGNIDLLEEEKKNQFPRNRVKLWNMAEVVGNYFNLANPPLLISNACISGVLALNTAFRYISSGYYKNIIVAGGDMITEFVVSGFLSFQALSPETCKPFDAHRTGLTIGEGCGTMILSDTPSGRQPEITISGAAVTNDANHISGPSRTGQELALAMQRAMDEAGVSPGEIDYVSAHGTATIYNDEMESKALAFAGLSTVPVNSYKGYWGHTLGAAGVIESILTNACMRENTLIASFGFSEPGTPEPLNVISENSFTEINNSLKIASGFGGCNGAVIFRKQ